MSAKASETEAQELMAKADKKANSTSWFGGNKHEEAADLYARAANSYKMAKLWNEAGNAFNKQAEMQLQQSERDEASNTFINASKCFKKSNPSEAVNALKQAIEILTERGRFHAAANNQKAVAEIYESDLVDLEKAMTSYELAADWFLGEEATALANACLLKVATFAAQLEQYDKAIEKFDQVANSSIDNQLTKWSVKDYFFKAGLCHMCRGDVVGTQRALDRYCEMDVTFAQTRECQLLRAIMEAVENGDLDLFTNQVADFDRMTRLDSWKTSLLLRIKKEIQEEEPSMT